LPRLDLAEKVVGAAFIHDLAPDNLLHARMLRRPWGGAELTALDETAVRRAGGAPLGNWGAGGRVGLCSPAANAGAGGGERARARATWTGGAQPPREAGEPDWLKRQEVRDRVVETGAAPGAAGNRVLEATFSRPFLAYGSIGPSCALSEYRDGELKVWT